MLHNNLLYSNSYSVIIFYIWSGHFSLLSNAYILKFVEFSQGMILPSKDSPVLQRSGIAQDSEVLKAAVNNPTAVEDNNKKNSKWLDN